MQLVEESLATTQTAGTNPDSPQGFLRQAFELEKECAVALQEKEDMEPSRSILFRSAASLALQCSCYRDAMWLVEAALKGDPPADIRNELFTISKKISDKAFLRC